MSTHVGSSIYGDWLIFYNLFSVNKISQNQVKRTHASKSLHTRQFDQAQYDSNLQLITSKWTYYESRKHLITVKLSPLFTVLPAKSESEVMFRLQSYLGLRIDRSLVYQSYPQDRINTHVIYRFALAQMECTS